MHSAEATKPIIRPETPALTKPQNTSISGPSLLGSADRSLKLTITTKVRWPWELIQRPTLPVLAMLQNTLVCGPRPGIPVKQTMTISSHPACKPVLHLTHNISHQNEQKNILLLNSTIKLCTSFTAMRMKVQSHSYNTCRHHQCS